MNFEYIKKLFADLEDYLRKYGNNTILQEYRIVNNTIRILESTEDDETKKQIVIQNYKSLYPGKGGLSEFYIWDNDFAKRMELNGPLDKIHNQLWEIVKEYI